MGRAYVAWQFAARRYQRAVEALRNIESVHTAGLAYAAVIECGIMGNEWQAVGKTENIGPYGIERTCVPGIAVAESVNGCKASDIIVRFGPYQ